MSTTPEARIQAAIKQAKKLPEDKTPKEIREGIVRILDSALELAADPTAGGKASPEQIAERISVAFSFLIQAKSICFQLQSIYHPVKTIRPLRQLVRKLDRALDALQPILVRQENLVA